MQTAEVQQMTTVLKNSRKAFHFALRYRCNHPFIQHLWEPIRCLAPGGPSLVAQLVKNSPASARDTRDVGVIPRSGRSMKKEMATCSSILAWKISWTEKPGGLQSMGLQRVGHNWSLMHLCLLRYQGAGIHGWKGWVSAPVCGEKGEDKCTRDLPVVVKVECGNKLLLEMMVVQVNISQVHSEGRSMVKNNQERKTLTLGSSSNWASESAGRDPVVSNLEVPPPWHQDRSQTLRPTAGIPNLWDLMPSDLRRNWCNNNRNKAYNKCNALESSLNQSPAPHQLSMEKLFHETSPWCQKVWGLLS